MTTTEELLQIVDELNGEPTGQLVPRKEAIANGLWCRSTNIYVLNSSGAVLCHQRSLHKERFPGVWSTHLGGHVTEGESFKINALKELEEEIGLKINGFQLIPWRTSKKEHGHLWMRDFLTVYDGALEDLTLQKEEIEQVAWYTAEEILEHINAQEYDADSAWLAGTHDFYADYQCMRAVLTAALDAGLFSTDYHHLHQWHPPVRAKSQE